MKRQLLRSLRSHGHHIILTVSIISLVSLTAWWTVFIRNSIRQQNSYRLDKLESDMKLYSYELTLEEDRGQNLTPGVLAGDSRFEIVPVSSPESAISLPLHRNRPDLRLQVRPETLDRIDKETARLNIMLIGEAGVFVFVALVSVIFLYLFIRLERRTADEIRFFWERTAHEVKTPITGIRAFLENLKAGTFGKGGGQDYVDLALEQVKRQEHLAENLLYGYMTKGAGKHLRCVKLDIVSFLKIYFAESTLQLAGADVELRFDQNIQTWVWADDKALKVILDNIADNAVRYCGSSLVLAVHLAGSRAQTRIGIRDNGPGFSSNVAENIFHAFKQTDEELPVRRKGTGMGMHISRALARKMGGDLKAHSEGRGSGTEFLIILRKAGKA